MPTFRTVGTHRMCVLGKINRLADRSVFECCKVTAAPTKSSANARSMALRCLFL
jgi:hypothetical protein